MMATKIAVPEISLNTRDFSSIRLATQGMTYSQRRFRQAIDQYVSSAYVYKLSQGERSIFWELIVSVILGKELYINMCLMPNGFRYLALSILNLAPDIFLPSLSMSNHNSQLSLHTDSHASDWRITAGGEENIARQIQNTLCQISETVRNRTHIHIHFFS
jgi:hypothetical protein